MTRSEGRRVAPESPEAFLIASYLLYGLTGDHFTGTTRQCSIRSSSVSVNDTNRTRTDVGSDGSIGERGDCSFGVYE
jgi:hypothetical protein